MYVFNILPMFHIHLNIFVAVIRILREHRMLTHICSTLLIARTSFWILFVRRHLYNWRSTVFLSRIEPTFLSTTKGTAHKKRYHEASGLFGYFYFVQTSLKIFLYTNVSWALLQRALHTFFCSSKVCADVDFIFQNFSSLRPAKQDP